MRIAVVGATGPTGRLVIEEALNREHEVVAYVRRPDALTHYSGLVIVGGQLDETARFAEILRGCDVLVCTLGTRSMRERRFMSTHLPLVTAAMLQAGVPRLVLMSALGVGDIPNRSRGASRLIFRMLSNFVFSDRTCSERALTTSGIRWSAVYPGFLSDTPAHSIQVGDLDRVRGFSSDRIPRENVAKVLLDLAEDPAADGRRIALARQLKI